jgi:hypothetical protein
VDFFEERLGAARGRATERRRAFAWPASAGAAPAPPLKVLMSDGERSAFSGLRHPGLVLGRPGDEGFEQPDMLVLTHAERLDFEQRRWNLPDGVWDRIASSQATLILDASCEGNPHRPHRTRAIYRFLKSRGVRPGSAAYVTQDRGYEQAYAAHRRESGLGGEPMQVFIYDQFIRWTFDFAEGDGPRQFDKRFKAYRARHGSRSRRFLSLNHTVRPAKALLLLKLLHERLWNAGYISVGQIGRLNSGRVLEPEAFVDQLASLPGVEDLVRQLAPHLETLQSLSPISFGLDYGAPEKRFKRQLIGPDPLPEYGRSWFSVVTESHVSDRLHRITEKPFKPILNFHPYVVLGSLGALSIIRAYGFDTFPQLFDESYDEAETLRVRFDKVFANIERLCRMEEAELARAERAAAETVIFNAWWGFVELPELFDTRINPAFVDQLRAFHASRVG